MTEIATGWLGYVTSETLGSQTTVDADAGDSELTVADVSDFLGGGGWVDVDQAGTPFEYTDATLNDDGTTGVLTLAVNLSDDIAADSRLDLWDIDAGEAYLEYFAGVTFPGDSGPTKVHLPGSLVPLFRDQAGVSVDVELEDDGWWVKRPRSQKPRANLGMASDDPIRSAPVVNAWTQNPDEFASSAHPEFLGDGDITGNVNVKGSMGSGGGASGASLLQPQGVVFRKSSGETASIYLNDDLQLDRHRGIFEGPNASISDSTFLGGQVDIGQGTVFQLRSTTIPPSVAPTGDEDWPSAPGDFSGYAPALRRGLAMVSTSVAYTLQRIEQPGYDEIVLVGVDPRENAADTTFVSAPTGGDLLGVYRLTGGPADVNRVGVTYSALNNRLVTIGTDNTDWLIESWAMPSGDSAAWVSSWTWTDGEHPSRPAGAYPAITCTEDGGQDRIVIAQTHKGDGKVIVSQYLDGVLDDDVTTTTALDLGDLAGVALFDANTRAVLVSAQTTPGNPYRDADGNVAMPLVNLSTGVLVTPAMPVGYANAAAAGISHLDGDPLTDRIWYVSASSNRTIQHSDPAASGYLFLAGAWGDTASGGVTCRGPLVQVRKRRGTRIGVVLSALPAGVDSGLLYAAAGNTPPPDASLHAQNEPLTAGSVFVQIFNLDTSGSTPVAVSTFPTGSESVSKIVDENGVTLMDSSGYIAGSGGGGADLDDDIYADESTGDIYFVAT